MLGGGQLGRMLALEGIPLGHSFTFLEPSPNPPSGALGAVIAAPYDDQAALARIAGAAEVVTYEFENVPASSAAFLADRLPVFPPPAALRATQDRLAEKQMFQELGIPTAPFHPLNTPAELDAALDATGLPAVIKTRRFGYDGKGQTVAHSAEEAAAALALLGSGLLAERFIDFERELSILAVRGRGGSRVFYPLTENHHSGGILRASHAPAAGITPALQAAAEETAGRVMDRLAYVGVLAIELFEARGRLLANEMAPRVHNSGHWTLDGADTSQFENHVRAVTGLPLAVPRMSGPAAMVNIIGELPDPATLAAIPGVHLHLYGKSPAGDGSSATSTSPARTRVRCGRPHASSGRCSRGSPSRRRCPLVSSPRIDPGEHRERRGAASARRLGRAVSLPVSAHTRSRAMLDEIKTRISEEVESLTHELNVVLPDRIRKAVELGDLRENSEYKSALERQQFVQARIGHLAGRMAEVSRIDVDDMPADRVGFGSRIRARDLVLGEAVTFTIVAGDFIDLEKGHISLDSPLGRGFLGAREGDEVTIRLPAGERRFKVVELTTLPQQLAEEGQE